MKTDLYSVAKEKIGTVELPDAIFDAPARVRLVHQAVVTLRANARLPWAHAKGRGEVRGGGKKPWRQKGTGRARHGSTRSPIWAHGGVSHGPVKTRNYEKKINKKMKQAALFSALSKKLRDGSLFVVRDLKPEEPKTKQAAAILKAFRKEPAGRESFLLVPASGKSNLFRASRNIERVTALAPASLNVYEVIKHKNILIDESAISTLNSTFLSAE